MTSRRNGHSELRNDEEEVDYDEEPDAEQSTASGTSHTQTNLNERVAGNQENQEFPLTQQGDGFNIDGNEETSLHDSLSISHHSDYSYKSEYDGKGFLKSYSPLTTPKLDYGVARMGIDKKLVAFIKDEMVHNTKPEVAFSTKGFSILNNVFKALHEEEQNSFFKVLDTLKTSLTTALSSCLHYSLVVKCIDQKWFWPELANEIGITPPTPKPSLMFGKSQ